MLYKQKFVYLLLALVLFGVIVVIRFGVLGGDEDTWICDDGRWVRHGNPSVSKPNSPCK